MDSDFARKAMGVRALPAAGGRGPQRPGDGGGDGQGGGGKINAKGRERPQGEEGQEGQEGQEVQEGQEHKKHQESKEVATCGEGDARLGNQPSVQQRPGGTELFVVMRCAFVAQQLDCPAHSRLRVVSAWWNRRQDPACQGVNTVPDPAKAVGPCSPNATDRAAAECDGKECCVLPEESACAENPFRLMRVRFACEV
mmetsp:Transcript_46027/g.142614  ORF Transcript_46027/g.142614 Transcript_46027/m.142614 type:complete len:197 (+) Transcript_46027:2-592(+)